MIKKSKAKDLIKISTPVLNTNQLRIWVINDELPCPKLSSYPRYYLSNQHDTLKTASVICLPEKQKEGSV